MTDTTITGLRTTQLRVPWVGEPPPNGIMAAEDRLYLVVEIMTKGGLTGMGYLQPLRGGIDTIDTCLKEMIAPMILGRDATEIEGIWQSIWKGTYWMGRMGVTVFAQSAVDIALWDIVGKRAGLPLYRLWGKARSEVQAYGSGCWRGLGRDGMIDKAKRFTGMGMKAIKMQAAHIRPWREDVKNVFAMREALGPDIEIMIDVNMGWTADTAIQAGRHFDEVDVYWMEEPVVCEDFEGYKRVAAALKTRVVGGETPLHALRHAPLLHHAEHADPAAGHDARRPDRAAQDRRRCRHLGHSDRAAPVPRADGARAVLDPQRQLRRVHGLERRHLGRVGYSEERHA